ncbi:MAG: YkgJ family cysteine cluster protein [Fervidicoccaceae archaeon]
MGKLRLLEAEEKFRFSCERCDLCCGTGPNVSVTIFDAVRMAKKVGVGVEEFIRTYLKVILADMIPVMTLQGDMKGRCVFLGFDHEGKTYCKIYEARPMKCRLYPLKIVKLSGNLLALDEECPGVGKGEETQPPWEEIENYRKELKRHYEILMRFIIHEGKDPLDALREALILAKGELEKH